MFPNETTQCAPNTNETKNKSKLWGGDVVGFGVRVRADACDDAAIAVAAATLAAVTVTATATAAAAVAAIVAASAAAAAAATAAAAAAVATVAAAIVAATAAVAGIAVAAATLAAASPLHHHRPRCRPPRCQVPATPDCPDCCLRALRSIERILRGLSRRFVAACSSPLQRGHGTGRGARPALKRMRSPAACSQPHRSAAANAQLAAVERILRSPWSPSHSPPPQVRPDCLRGDFVAGQFMPRWLFSAASRSRAPTLVRALTRGQRVRVQRSEVAARVVRGVRWRSRARSKRTLAGACGAMQHAARGGQGDAYSIAPRVRAYGTQTDDLTDRQRLRPVPQLVRVVYNFT